MYKETFLPISVAIVTLQRKLWEYQVRIVMPYWFINPMCASPIPADLRQFSLRVFIHFLFERILAFVGGPSRSSGLRPSASAAPQHDDQDGRSYERFTTRTTSGKSTSQHSRSGLWFSKPLDKYPESEFDLSSGLGFSRPLDKYLESEFVQWPRVFECPGQVPGERI